MKTNFTFGLFLSFFLFVSALNAQTVLFNFETGTTQLGTYSMAWPGAPYIASYAPSTNPGSIGINTTSTSLNLVESSGVNWWDNLSVFTLTTPTTITNANRYLHIMYRTSNIAGGGYSININLGNMNGIVNSTRFDGNLTANNTWQDIVVDLNYLITNNVQLSSFGMNPDLNGWGGGSGGTYNFDEIILSNNPLPRGTSFLTGNNLYDFEPGTAANISGVNTSANTDNPVTYPFANPMNNTKNSTANVGKRSVIVASPQWWSGFSFSFVNPVLIDAEHKYLHILVSVPVDGQKIALDVRQGATNIISDGLSTISTANVWQDVVYDVSGLAYISGLSLKMGHWDGAAVGDYYFDEIYIDGSATSRTAVATVLKDPSSMLKIYATNNKINIVNAGIESQLNIYNANGQNIISKQIRNNEIIAVNNAGLYFVKVGSQTTKVLVK
jgi:hypothetical protein